jgi:phosphoglycolate phosphatase
MSDMILKPRAVFFDWDGTLVDSFEFLYRAHNHVRGVLGFDSFSIETFGGYFGQPREKLYTEIYGEHREEAKTHFEAFVLANHVNDLKPLDGAAEVLSWYADAGIPMGVVTNKKGDLVRKEIANFGWEKHFVTVVGAAEAAEDKPSAAPLLLALEKAGFHAPHGDIVYVGDTDNDLLCAQAAGCGSVLIADDEEYEALAKAHKIDVRFESCRGFYDFLLQFSINSLNTKTIG